MSIPASSSSCSVDVEEPTSSGAVFHIDCNSDVKQEPEYYSDYEYHEDPLAIKEEPDEVDVNNHPDEHPVQLDIKQEI